MIALVTGFDPFGADTLNASAAALRLLPGEIGAVQVIREILPTSFARAWPALQLFIGRDSPDLVLLLGQAGGRAGLSLETQALNSIEARVPDNDGARPTAQPVITGANQRYETSLPLQDILAALRRSGFPAYRSEDAGGFVCNATLFSLLHYLAEVRTEGEPLPNAGFIHLPWLPEQIGSDDAPFLSAKDASAAIACVIAVCSEHLKRRRAPVVKSGRS